MTVPETSGGSEDDTSTDTTDETAPTDTAPDGGAEGGQTAPDEPLDQPNPGNGGTPAPDGNDPPADPPRDSPENDLPPAAGSPEERFEQFCEENPGAC